MGPQPTGDTDLSPRDLLRNPRLLLELLQAAHQSWQADRASRLAAALAYYALFSAVPLLLLILTILGRFLGRNAAHIELLFLIERATGPGAARAVESLIQESGSSPTGSLLLSIASFIATLVTASGAFFHLQDALDTVWGVAFRPERGVLRLVRNRLAAFAMMLVVGLLLIASLVTSTILTLLSQLLGNPLPGLPIWRAADLALSLALTTVLFALVYRILPSVRIAWSDVWIGAGVTALLFTIGKLLITFYLARSGLASAYGAAGSVFVLLVWVYYSAQIFLIGAEMTFVYANRYGSRMRLPSYAYFREPATRHLPPAPTTPPAAALPPAPRAYLLALAGFLVGLLLGVTGRHSDSPEE